MRTSILLFDIVKFLNLRNIAGIPKKAVLKSLQLRQNSVSLRTTCDKFVFPNNVSVQVIASELRGSSNFQPDKLRTLSTLFSERQ